MNDKRKCNVCGEKKLLEAFRKNRNQCKKCANAKNNAKLKEQQKKKHEEAIKTNELRKCKICEAKKNI